MAFDLVPIWTAILAVSVFMYVLLDGFDLGVGILFPLAPDDPAALGPIVTISDLFTVVVPQAGRRNTA